MGKIPKIELHCHLDGSVRPATIIEIAQEEGITLPTTNLNQLKQLLIAPEECASLADYLERFALPNKVMQSKASLQRITYELFEDAAKENVKYMEVRFGPLLHTLGGLTLTEVIESVILGMRQAEARYSIKGNLILGCLRSMPIDTAIDIVEAGRSFLGKGVVAVDLCAIEEAGFCESFVPAITLAKSYGYHVTIHAGETGIGQNVYDAIETLGAERIGHGVFIKDHPAAYQLVKKKGIVLEMCPTSNIQTKAIEVWSEHPFAVFHRDGIKVTLNTDNRTVSNTTMTQELARVHDAFGFQDVEYQQVYETSVQAAFANQAVKDWCLAQFAPYRVGN